MILLAKLTLLLLAGLLAAGAMRRSTPALRHLLCVCALAGSLILPLSMLAPSSAVTIRVPVQAIYAMRTTALAAPWPWPRFLMELWLAGSALLVLRLAIGYWRVARLIRTAIPIGPSVLRARVTVPIASGLFRPVVLMPANADEWPESRYGAALRHERAHIERRDLHANLMSALACAIWWFHPLVWLLAALQRNQQEAACDDAVIHSGFDPADYSEALLAAARNPATTLLFGCPMTTQMNVKTRITRLLDRGIARTTSPATLRRSALAFGGLLLAIGLLGPARAEQIYNVGGDVSGPRVLYKIEPAYTTEARDAKIAGTVLLSLVVGADGLAHEISIQRGVDPGLDQNAVTAVQQWRFAPGMRNGEPVSVRAQIEINFRLE